MFNYMNLECILKLVAAPLIEMLLMTLSNLANFIQRCNEFPSRMFE